jgi:hypothetical protein
MSENTTQDRFRSKVMFGGVEQSFPDIQAFSDWTAGLVSEWQWTGSDATGSPFWQRLGPPLQSAQSLLSQALQNVHGNADHTANLMQQARMQIENTFSGTTVLSDRSAHSFVQDIRDRVPELAGSIVCLLAGVEPNIHSHTTLARAVFEVELYRRGFNALDPATDALKALETEHRTAISNLDEARQNALISHRLFMESMTNNDAENQRAISETNHQRAEAWSKLLSNGEDRLSRLETTYDAHMALSKPAAYWTRKRMQHRIASGVLGVLLVAAMTGLSTLLYSELNQLAPVLQAQLAGQKTATPLQLGTLVAFSTVGFWFVRILVKLFLSQIHLENDASERITMIRTYLALARGGKLKDDDLKAIVTAVFRPTGDGIVKDEGLSLPLTELLLKK